MSERRRRSLVWLLYAAVLAAAPLVFRGNLALTLLSQIGCAIVVGLSCNLLLGQGGMLSFGHAVYSGLGACAVIHVLQLRWNLPVSLLPLVGGVAAASAALLLGWFTTRRSGTAFAMITLGVGELVHATALMWPALFGGESGLQADRVLGAPVMGISFGPPLQVYALIAAYCFVCSAALFAFTHTPLGRLLLAVRDNAERVAFLGQDPKQVRFIVFVVAGFFAGIGGGLGALLFESVSADNVSGLRSGTILLFTVLGGTGSFVGPIIGAVLLVLMTGLLAAWTPAWPMYLGLAFVGVVMWAPGGVTSIGGALVRRPPQLLAGPALGLLAAGLAVACGVVVLVEMLYRLQLGVSPSAPWAPFGLDLQPDTWPAWAGALLLLAAGVLLWRPLWRRARAT